MVQEQISLADTQKVAFCATAALLIPLQTRPPRATRPNGGLPLEIWGLICQEVRDISIHTLLDLCVVSRIVNGVAIPQLYYRISFIQPCKIIKLFDLSQKNYERLRRYTKHIKIEATSSHITQPWIKRAIKICGNLQSFHWHENLNQKIQQHGSNNNYGAGHMFPSPIRKALLNKGPDVKLYLDAHCITSRDTEVFLISLTPNLLPIIRSFRCRFEPDSLKHSHSDLSRLSSFIAKMPNLADLSVQITKLLHGQTSTSLFLPTQNEQYPAITSLHLVGYRWPRIPHYFFRTWDFSSLTRLEIYDVSLRYFFSSVPMERLHQLKVLGMSEKSLLRSLSQPQDLLTPDFQRILWTKLPFLEELSIGPRFTDWLNLHDLVNFRSRLRKLDLSLRGGNGASLLRQRSVSLKDLKFIRRICPCLTYLGVTMKIDKPMVHTYEYLSAICSFPNLTVLKLDADTGKENKQTQSLDTNSMSEPYTKITLLISSMVDGREVREVDGPQVLNGLIRRKLGVPFDKILFVVKGRGMNVSVPGHFYERERETIVSAVDLPLHVDGVWEARLQGDF